MKLFLTAPDDSDHLILVGFKQLCNLASVFNTVGPILSILLVLLYDLNYRGWSYRIQSWLSWD